METTMKLAIETYSQLTGESFDTIQNECISGNDVVIENIMKLMFCVSI